VSAENASERPTGNRSEPDSCGPDCAVPSLIQRLQAAEEERDRYKAALKIANEKLELECLEPVLALTPPTKSEEKR
jgi:hypothetical protein